MSKLSIAALVTSIGLASAGCGSGSSAEQTSGTGFGYSSAGGSSAGGASESCTFPASCIEWSVYQTTVQAACAEAGGTYSAAPCPESNRVGRCLLDISDAIQLYYRMTYSFYEGSAAELEADCQAVSGSWSAG